MICKKCGIEIVKGGRFCPKCGGTDFFNPETNNVDKASNLDALQPYNQDLAQSNVVEHSQRQKKNGLIIAIIILSLLVVVGGMLAVILFINNESRDSKQSQMTESSIDDAQSEKDGQEDLDGESKEIDGNADLTNYQKYYDSVNATFDKLIIAGSDSGEFSAYLQGLATALSDKNASSCKFNYDKLVELEEKLKTTSENTIKNLKKKIKNLKKKSASKKTKSSVNYIQLETKAEVAYESSDFKTAQKLYNECISKLNKGIKKAKKNKKTRKTDDSLYMNTGYDNYTYDYVCNYWMESSDVRGLSSETKRYYINTLFAAYGYRFSNDTIQSFYNRQSWYSPDFSIPMGDQSRVQQYFSSTARHNMALLKG